MYTWILDIFSLKALMVKESKNLKFNLSGDMKMTSQNFHYYFTGFFQKTKWEGVLRLMWTGCCLHPVSHSPNYKSHPPLSLAASSQNSHYRLHHLKAPQAPKWAQSTFNTRHFTVNHYKEADWGYLFLSVQTLTSDCFLVSNPNTILRMETFMNFCCLLSLLRVTTFVQWWKT